MPEIPDFTKLGKRPAPRGRTDVTQVQTRTGHEGDMAQATRQLGQAAGQFGEDVQKVQDKHDSVAVEDAWNKLQIKSQDLEANSETGFKLVRGSAVGEGDFYNEQITRFGDASGEISAGLSNDRQREMFRQRSEISKKGYSASLMNHQATETDRYISSVEETTLKVGTSNIMANPLDGVAVESSLVRSKAALQAKGERMGQDQEQIDNNIKDYYEANVANLVVVTANTSVETARTYMERYDEYLGEDTKIKINKQLDTTESIEYTQVKTDEIRAAHPEYKDQIAAARKLKGNERKQVTASITAANDLDKKIEKQSQITAADDALGLLNSGQKVPPSLYGEMDSKTALAVRQREISGVAPTRDNLSMVDQLNNLSTNDMMTADLNQYSHGLTDSTLNKYKNEQQQLKGGNQTGATKRQRITQAVKTVFGGKAAPEEYAHVQSLVDTWSAEQSPPPDWKQTQEFLDGLQKDVITGNMLWWDSETKKGKIQVEGVPDKDILKIVEKLEKDNVDASEDNIKKLYDVGAGIGLF